MQYRPFKKPNESKVYVQYLAKSNNTYRWVYAKKFVGDNITKGLGKAEFDTTEEAKEYIKYLKDIEQKVQTNYTESCNKILNKVTS